MLTIRGSILSPEWVLTAQHCVEGLSPSSRRIEAGATLSSAGQVRNIDEILVYPGYQNPETGKDAALLHLSSPLTFSSSVGAIAYATAADVSAGLTDPGVTSTVTGWGLLSSGSATFSPAPRSPRSIRAISPGAAAAGITTP